MSAIRLLVLGAVRQHGRAHGYQVRNDLEYWGAHEWSNAKPGSIYHALKQMAKQGLLHAHEVAPSTAGGPPRTEYEITDEGTEEFRRLLHESLVAYDQKMDLLSAAIGFIVDLRRDEALELLRERIRRIGEWRTAVTEHYIPEDGPGRLGHIGEIMNLWVHTADSDAAWTRGLIERIEGGAYTFAGEGEPFVGVLAQGEENPYATGEPRPGDTHCWLGTAVQWNPMSRTATAVRDLFGGPGGEPGHVWAAVAWPLALLAVFLPLAVRRFGRLSA